MLFYLKNGHEFVDKKGRRMQYNDEENDVPTKISCFGQQKIESKQT